LAAIDRKGTFVPREFTTSDLNEKLRRHCDLVPYPEPLKLITVITTRKLGHNAGRSADHLSHQSNTTHPLPRAANTCNAPSQVRAMNLEQNIRYVQRWQPSHRFVARF